MGYPSPLPIAVLGYGCRLPGGVVSGQGFWELLCNGRDAVGEIPPGRWSTEAYHSEHPGVAGRTVSRWGGFLDRINEFEPECFGLSPREATFIDPQQRLLLETTWEALESAGLPVASLSGSRTGVFVGISNVDYAHIQSLPSRQRGLGAFTATGSSASIAANRISYCLDLRGPSISVDTACSSSLVALDVAVKNLRVGQADLAIVGGVNVLLLPDTFIMFSMASMLSPDGRCKAFDASANGFVRSEGAGVVLLKRLDDAMRDDDPVLAVILGTGTNQDGRTGGISLPSVDAQEQLLRTVYQEAGIALDGVSYIEAHGTGTAVGDPAEAEALGRVFAGSRANGCPLYMGSVKSNIGHLEPASGVASLIKAILMVQHRHIPPSLHFRKPNPAIDFEGWRLKVPTSLEKWPNDGRAVIGVNSFGFGGANAHVVLGEFQSDDWQSRRHGPTHASSTKSGVTTGEYYPVLLSARNDEAFQSLAESWVQFLTEGDRSDRDFPSIAYSSVCRRTHNRFRLGFAARGIAEAAEIIQSHILGENARGSWFAEAPHRPPRVAFVFCGQGAHWHGMGRELFQREAVFRDAMERCDELIRPFAGLSVIDELRKGEGNGRLERTSVAQPVLFALQTALDALWRSWGVEPDAVVGHSVGELAAAHASGAISLEAAARIVTHRGACLEEHVPSGKMIAVALSESAVLQLVGEVGEEVFVAATNSPDMVTLAGDASAVTNLGTRLDERDVWWRPLAIQRPFHTPWVDPAREPFLISIGGVACEKLRIPFFSTVTGTALDEKALDSTYWWDNIRHPVRFAETIQELLRQDVNVFVEIGPHPVLGSSIRQSRLPGSPVPVVFPSLRRDADESGTMRSSLAGLHAHGVPGKPGALWPENARYMELPPHPWVKQEYWHECPEIRDARLAVRFHPLLGHGGLGASGTWEATLDTAEMTWLRGHVIDGRVLFPAAGFVEIALAVATRTEGADTCTIDGLVIRRGIFLSNESTCAIQTTVDPATSAIAVSARVTGSEDEWIPHCDATYRALSTAVRPAPLNLDNRKENAHGRMTGTDFYRRFQAMGYEYGPAFQPVAEVYQGGGWAVGRVEASDKDTDSASWHIHPTVLDGCFQVLLGTLPQDALPQDYIMLPDRIERINFRRSPGKLAWCEARLKTRTSGRFTGDVSIFRADGEPAVEISGFQCQAVPRFLRRDAMPIEKCFCRTHWRYKPILDAPVVAESLSGLDLRALVQAANTAAERMRCEATVDRIGHGYQYIDRLTLAYVAQGLRALGFSLKSGERIDAQVLVEAGKLQERFKPHFCRCLRWLFESDATARVGEGQWTLSSTADEQDLDSLWREALALHPESYRLFRLIEVCGRRLPDIWAGTLDPLELLLSAECVDLLEHTYQDAMPSRNANTFIQLLVGNLVAALPPRRPVRILEIGAGTGATTAYVAPALPWRRSEYWFTDLSPFFLARGEEKLREHEFIRFHSVDIERPLAEQGIPANAFDVVIAAHVLHATRSVEDTVRRCREALVDGGLLIATETCVTSPFQDMIFGMTEGWWFFREDAIRADGPHLSRGEWLSVMESSGFEQCCALGDDRERQTVLVGRAPGGEPGAVLPPVAIEKLPPERNWVVFSDQSAPADLLLARLRERGLRCIEVSLGDPSQPENGPELWVSPDDEQALLRLRDQCRAGMEGDYSILYMWPLTIPATEYPSEDVIDEAETLACYFPMGLLQTFGGEGADAPRRLLLVTRGAQVLPGDRNPAAFLQAPLVGLARVAAGEFPALKVRMIDVDPANDQMAETLWAEMAADDQEEEVAWRGCHRFIPRLELAEASAARDSVTVGEEGVPFKVGVQQLGNLNRLALRESRSVQLGSMEIQVDVIWAALNFRDVLSVLGKNGIAKELALGMECAGVVRAVGEQVTEFQSGDRVVLCSAGSMQSVMTVHARCAAKLPDSMSLLAAVSMPVAFITADYALRRVGRLREGERVLVHAGAGGVGLAAIQLSRNAGAQIYATAGSPAKRDLLSKLGVHRIMDSRSLDFADEILHETNGQGVDVVLNSLAGQAMLRSVACLGPFGRFLELGKRDFTENTKLGLWPLRSNVSYHAVDVAPFLGGKDGSRVASAGEIMRLAAEGQLAPLPVEVFPVARATDAFRFMAQGFHVGKVVLDMTRHWGQIHRLPPSVRVRPDATYLVTGAFGGIGLLVARWLVESGARHLMLISRKGPESDTAVDLIQELRERGADVHVRKCDVGDHAQLASVFDEIDMRMPALAGVFHLAMVLDDAAVLNMTRSRFRDVMRPKFRGACNLHLLCRNRHLDHFVLFSSASASSGFPGQSNYAAANAGLEGLATYRRAHGLPAIAIAWGLLGEVGYAARRPEVVRSLRQSGYYEIGPDDFLRGFELALGADEAVQGVARVDWHMEVQKLRARGNRRSLLSSVVDVQNPDSTLLSGLARDAILAAAPEERIQLVHDLLRDLMARVLGMRPDRIEPDKPLPDLGFDSLMAIELASQVESHMGLTLPLRALRDEVTLMKLSEALARMITNSNDGSMGQRPARAEPVAINT